MQNYSAELAHFAANLSAQTIPASVMNRAEDLLVDWFGSAIAGKGAQPAEIIAQFAQAMGPNLINPQAYSAGAAEILLTRQPSSPYLAAMANAAASHVAEQDNATNGSAFHPATVVFPPGLALSQVPGFSGAK